MNIEEYSRRFGLNSISDGDSNENLGQSKSKAERALEIALDIRKFEIEMYWKRATYFWAFIALTLGGYATVLTSSISPVRFKGEVLLASSCLGLIFSVAWFFVNRASKFWQQNWERHLDLLEDNIHGPLYKTVIEEQNLKFWSMTGSYSFSVSKINQLLSLFVVFLFVALIVVAVLVSWCATWPIFIVEPGIILVTVGAVATLSCKGRTHDKTEKVIVMATERQTEIAGESLGAPAPDS